MSNNLFPLGEILLTTGAVTLCGGNFEIFTPYLKRHQTGDWGDVSVDHARANDLAVKAGTRIVSVYHTSDGVEFHVVTETKFSRTHIELPGELWRGKV